MRIYIVLTIIVLALLSACDGAAITQGNPDIYSLSADAWATLEFAQAQERATQESARLTQAVVTQAAARATQQAQIEIDRATAAAAEEAARVQATQQAAALEVIRADATATADSRATEGAFSSTMTVQALGLQTTLTVEAMQLTSVAGLQLIQERELELDRARINNRIKALYGYILTSVLIGVFAYVLVLAVRRLTSVRHFRRDHLGNQGMVWDVDKKKLLLPELAPTAVVDINNPPQVDQATANYIKSNSQRIEAVRAANSRQIQGVDLAGLFGADVLAAPQVEIIDAESVREILDEVETKLLDRPE